MKAIDLDSTNRRNLKVTFDDEINVEEAAVYIADVYKTASGDESIRATNITGLLRHRLFEMPGDERDYSVVDGSRRNGLFNISGNMVFIKKDYWVSSYHARPEETDILIDALGKICSE